MKIVTKRSKIRSAAARWKKQYYNEQRDFWGNTTRWVWDPANNKKIAVVHSSRGRYEKLLALDPDVADEDDIEAITGNRSWTTLRCVECAQDVPAGVVLEIGVLICAECLQAALEKLEETT